MSQDIRDLITVTGVDQAPASASTPAADDKTPATPGTGPETQVNDQAVGSTQTPAQEPKANEPENPEAQGGNQENKTKEERRQEGKKIEKKIDGLYKREAKATARAEAAEAELERLRQEYQALQERSKSMDLDTLTLDERVQELTQRQITEDAIKRRAAAATSEIEATTANEWASRVEAVQSRYPDFADVVGNAKVPLSKDLIQAIQESEYGPDIAYALASNPEVAQALYRSSPITASKMLLRIEQSIESQYGSAPAPAAAPVAANAAPSVAPTPTPTPTPAHAGRPPVQHAHQMDMADFIKNRRANGSLR